jgi:hypothetical protein
MSMHHAQRSACAFVSLATEAHGARDERARILDVIYFCEEMFCRSFIFFYIFFNLLKLNKCSFRVAFLKPSLFFALRHFSSKTRLFPWKTAKITVKLSQVTLNKQNQQTKTKN